MKPYKSLCLAESSVYTDAMRSPEKSLRRDPQRSEKSLENNFFYRKKKINIGRTGRVEGEEMEVGM